MSALSGKSILILATNGFEQSELEVTQAKLKEAGATVHVASPESGEIKAGQERLGSRGKRGHGTRRSAANRCCHARRAFFREIQSHLFSSTGIEGSERA